MIDTIDYKALAKYMKFLIRYKDDVVSRMKDAKDVLALRFPIGKLGDKKSIIEWLEEDFVRNTPEEELVRYLESKDVSQASATKLPNELVLELDIEDEAKAKLNYLMLSRSLDDMKMKYLAIYTGGKSIHYHIYLKPDGKEYLELRKIKARIVEYVKDYVEGLDLHVAHDTTPARLPFTLHPKTLKKCVFVNHEILNNLEPSWWDDHALNFFRGLENEVEYKEEKPELDVKGYNVYSLQRRYGKRSKSKLAELYYRILSEQWEDGKDRLLIILFCLAKKIGLSAEQFQKDILDWFDRQQWGSLSNRRKREASLNWFVRNYKEKNYGYKKFIKEFLTSSDIAEESRKKMAKILDELKIKGWFEGYQ